MIRGPDFELGVLSGKAKTGTARSVDPLNLTEKKRWKNVGFSNPHQKFYLTSNLFTKWLGVSKNDDASFKGEYKDKK